MIRSMRWQRLLVAGALCMTALVGLSPTGASASTGPGVAQVVPVPAPQLAGVRHLVIRVLSIHVYDDGDHGWAGCGQMADNRAVTINGVKRLTPDNGKKWTWLKNQKYCSDSTYTMPTGFPDGINRYSGAVATPGDVLHFRSIFTEEDPGVFPGSDATGEIKIAVPAAGTYQDFVLMVEGHYPDHVRLALTIRLRTQ